MYTNFYRFQEKPFSLTPDPKFLYLSKQHQGALDHMMYGIKQREGFIAVVGDVGMGKTTLCRCLLDRLEDNIKVALIFNPMVSDIDLLRTCVHDLGVKPAGARASDFSFSRSDGAADPFSSADEALNMDWVNKAPKKELIDALNEFLLAQHEAGGSTVLIIDEAQNLSLNVMEQLRMLSNLETAKEKLLQIIFVGQLELEQKLQMPELKQLNQRISIRYEITPLSKAETIKYINHRILVAGAGTRITFTHFALNEIFSYSSGYPRLINLVCDRALLAGFNAQVETIERLHVNQGIRSLLGEENKNYFLAKLFKERLPLAMSIMFFIGGLVLFLLSKAVNDPRFTAPKPAVAPQPVVQAPAPETGDSSTGGSAVAVAEEAPAVSPAVPTVEPPLAAAPQDAGGKDAVAENQAAAKNKTAKPPIEPVQGKYRVQVYSLSHQNRAEQEARNLQEEGFQASWKKVVTTDQDWFIVYVGPFQDIQQAKIRLNALKYSGRNPILISANKAR